MAPKKKAKKKVVEQEGPKVWVYILFASTDGRGNTWRRYQEYLVTAKTADRMLRRKSAELLVDRIARRLHEFGAQLLKTVDTDPQLVEACERAEVEVVLATEPLATEPTGENE